MIDFIYQILKEMNLVGYDDEPLEKEEFNRRLKSYEKSHPGTKLNIVGDTLYMDMNMAVINPVSKIVIHHTLNSHLPSKKDLKEIWDYYQQGNIKDPFLPYTQIDIHWSTKECLVLKIWINGKGDNGLLIGNYPGFKDLKLVNSIAEFKNLINIDDITNTNSIRPALYVLDKCPCYIINAADL